jgi:hypothetical protein
VRRLEDVEAEIANMPSTGPEVWWSGAEDRDAAWQRAGQAWQEGWSGEEETKDDKWWLGKLEAWGRRAMDGADPWNGETGPADAEWQYDDGELLAYGEDPDAADPWWERLDEDTEGVHPILQALQGEVGQQSAGDVHPILQALHPAESTTSADIDLVDGQAHEPREEDAHPILQAVLGPRKEALQEPASPGLAILQALQEPAEPWRKSKEVHPILQALQ